MFSTERLSSLFSLRGRWKQVDSPVTTTARVDMRRAWGSQQNTVSKDAEDQEAT